MALSMSQVRASTGMCTLACLKSMALNACPAWTSRLTGVVKEILRIGCTLFFKKHVLV